MTNPEFIKALATVLVPLCSMAASIVCAVISSRASRSVEKLKGKTSDIAAEFSPDHGNSLRDKVDGIQQMQRSQGHQIGEIRADLTNLRKDVGILQTREILG